MKSSLLTSFALLLFFALSQDVRAQTSPVPEGAEVEEVVTGFRFTEGPHWHPDGFLVFSDIPAGTIYRWMPDSAEADVYRRPSGNSNGIAEDLDGRLLLAQHGWRRIARVDSLGRETALATTYEGQRLNSPNDLAVRSDGTIYFTDPPYGIEEGEEELGFYGVYRIDPSGDSLLVLADSSFVRPNGVAFSPDERVLYVADSQERLVRAFDVAEDGTLSNRRLFVSVADSMRGSADGMEVDEEGNLYTTGAGGVWVVAPDGTVLDRIAVPQSATNVAWGGEDYRTLYITAGSSVYAIDLDVRGRRQGVLE